MDTNIDKELMITSSRKSPQDSASIHVEDTRYRAAPWWKFGGRDRSFIPSRLGASTSSLKSFQENRGIDQENTADDSVFNDATAIELYKPSEEYEGRHRFDPRANWSDEEEKKLIRRVSTALYFQLLTTSKKN